MVSFLPQKIIKKVNNTVKSICVALFVFLLSLFLFQQSIFAQVPAQTPTSLTANINPGSKEKLVYSVNLGKVIKYTDANHPIYDYMNGNSLGTIKEIGPVLVLSPGENYTLSNTVNRNGIPIFDQKVYDIFDLDSINSSPVQELTKKLQSVPANDYKSIVDIIHNEIRYNPEILAAPKFGTLSNQKAEENYLNSSRRIEDLIFSGKCVCYEFANITNYELARNGIPSDVYGIVGFNIVNGSIVDGSLVAHAVVLVNDPLSGQKILDPTLNYIASPNDYMRSWKYANNVNYAEVYVNNSPIKDLNTLLNGSSSQTAGSNSSLIEKNILVKSLSDLSQSIPSPDQSNISSLTPDQAASLVYQAQANPDLYDMTTGTTTLSQALSGIDYSAEMSDIINQRAADTVVEELLRRESQAAAQEELQNSDAAIQRQDELNMAKAGRAANSSVNSEILNYNNTANINNPVLFQAAQGNNEGVLKNSRGEIIDTGGPCVRCGEIKAKPGETVTKNSNGDDIVIHDDGSISVYPKDGGEIIESADSNNNGGNAGIGDSGKEEPPPPPSDRDPDAERMTGEKE